jgi:L-threonylcarbamoyladenylate synthase
MKQLPLSDGPEFGKVVLTAAYALREGGIILYPTDTLYGLGADAFSDEAVDKIYALKGRDPKKPIHAVFSDMRMVEEYAEVTDTARRLAERFLPGALTLILKKKEGVNGGIAREMQSIGVRIPDNSFCIETARSFGKPFTTTSANISDQATGLSVEEILAQFGSRQDAIDLVLDAGTLPLRPPSTVVSLLTPAPIFLRIGAIPKQEIENAPK